MQGVFDIFGDRRPEPRRPLFAERLFLAVFPDAEALRQITRFRQRFRRERRLGTPWSETRYPHVSLHHLGDFKLIRTKFIYAVGEAAKSVAMQPFDLTFHAVGSFAARPGRYPLVMLCEATALRQLHKALGAALTKNGLRAAADFTPHLTLLYGPERIAEHAIEPIRCRIGEFALIHSKLGLSQYRWIDRWPLAGGFRSDR